MLDIQELESKLTDLKYSVKNGKISGNAKGHDDLEHPLLQMMQQFVEICTTLRELKKRILLL